MLWIGEVMSY